MLKSLVGSKWKNSWSKGLQVSLNSSEIDHQKWDSGTQCTRVTFQILITYIKLWRPAKREQNHNFKSRPKSSSTPNHCSWIGLQSWSPQCAEIWDDTVTCTSCVRRDEWQSQNWAEICLSRLDYKWNKTELQGSSCLWIDGLALVSAIGRPSGAQMFGAFVGSFQAAVL